MSWCAWWQKAGDRKGWGHSDRGEAGFRASGSEDDGAVKRRLGGAESEDRM